MEKALPVVATLADHHPERTVFTRFIPPERPDQMPACGSAITRAGGRRPANSSTWIAGADAASSGPLPSRPRGRGCIRRCAREDPPAGQTALVKLDRATAGRPARAAILVGAFCFRGPKKSSAPTTERS
jgi:hypothetical protein